MSKIRDMYREYEVDGCTDNGKCGVSLPESFFTLCGEAIRDHVRGSGSGKTKKMCDCIILDAAEDRVTLAELKSGEPKAAMVRHAKYQFTEGMVVLREMLLQAGKTEVNLQFVLFTKQFRDSSALAELRKPLKYFEEKLRVIKTNCCSPLPNSYTVIKLSELPSI